MIKTLIFHHLLDMNDLPAAERWFYRYHVPEVLRNRPVSYVSYQAVPPPPGAEAYGYLNYKVHENLSRGEAEEPLALLAMTPEMVPLEVVMVNVPPTPTDDFLGSGLSHDDKTILRWLLVFRYPPGVSVEEGDDWYVSVHAREVLEQPGLTRFFSYRVLPTEAPVRQGVTTFLHPRSKVSSDWHRVTEQWYEDSNGWVDSVVKAPATYTRPPWAAYGEYPFFEPGIDFVSTFILERPCDDWTRQVTPFYV